MHKTSRNADESASAVDVDVLYTAVKSIIKTPHQSLHLVSNFHTPIRQNRIYRFGVIRNSLDKWPKDFPPALFADRKWIRARDNNVGKNKYGIGNCKGEVERYSIWLIVGETIAPTGAKEDSGFRGGGHGHVGITGQKKKKKKGWI